MGLMLAEPEFHTRCFVEWDEYPRSTIIAAQRAGYFAPAPIWDDVATFNAVPFAGAFDTLLAGYPCQPFSHAGSRKGETDERHLWPDIARIINEIGTGLRWCFFENVSGHLSLGLETVLRKLHELEFQTAVGLFSASEVGAPHERQRVFIVAHRERDDGRSEQQSTSARCGRPGPPRGREKLADANVRDSREERKQCGGKQRFYPECGKNSPELGHPRRAGPQRRKQHEAYHHINGKSPHGPTTEYGRVQLFPPPPNDATAWASIIRQNPTCTPSFSRRDIKTAALNLAAIFSSDEARRICARTHGLEIETVLRAVEIETPGLVDQAKALTGLRDLAHGLAQRPRALRLLGNGVVPLEAAYAWRTLSAAHGLGWVDLDAAPDTATANTN